MQSADAKCLLDSGSNANELLGQVNAQTHTRVETGPDREMLVRYWQNRGEKGKESLSTALLEFTPGTKSVLCVVPMKRSRCRE